MVFNAFKRNSSLSSDKIFPNPQYEAGDKNQSCSGGGDRVPQSTRGQPLVRVSGADGRDRAMGCLPPRDAWLLGLWGVEGRPPWQGHSHD